MTSISGNRDKFNNVNAFSNFGNSNSGSRESVLMLGVKHYKVAQKASQQSQAAPQETQQQSQVVLKKASRRAQAAPQETQQQSQAVLKKASRRAQAAPQETQQQSQAVLKKASRRAQAAPQETQQQSQAVLKKASRRAQAAPQETQQQSQVVLKKASRRAQAAPQETQQQSQAVLKKASRRAQAAPQETQQQSQAVLKKASRRAQAAPQETQQQSQAVLKKASRRAQAAPQETQQQSQAVLKKASRRAQAAPQETQQQSQAVLKKASRRAQAAPQETQQQSQAVLKKASRRAQAAPQETQQQSQAVLKKASRRAQAAPQETQQQSQAVLKKASRRAQAAPQETQQQSQVVLKKASRRAQAAPQETQQQSQAVLKKASRRAQAAPQETQQQSQAVLKKASRRAQAAPQETQQQSQAVLKKASRRAQAAPQETQQQSQAVLKKASRRAQAAPQETQQQSQAVLKKASRRAQAAPQETQQQSQAVLKKASRRAQAAPQETQQQSQAVLKKASRRAQAAPQETQQQSQAVLKKASRRAQAAPQETQQQSQAVLKKASRRAQAAPQETQQQSQVVLKKASQQSQFDPMTREQPQNVQSPKPGSDRYYSVDDRRNSYQKPMWGSTGSELYRMMNSGYSNERGGISGSERPGAGEVSNAVLAQGGDTQNKKGTSDLFWQWGQFIDNDITLVKAEGGESQPIYIPKGDPWFDPERQGNVKIPFTRSETSGGKEQVNSITSFLDDSMIYGSDQETLDKLRSFEGGKMRMTEDGLLPRDEKGMFIAGDERANEPSGLTSMRTLWVREHNYQADKISAENPAWSDEAIFQEVIRLIAAIIQHITDSEYLSLLVGREAISDYQGYDPSVNPNISNEFSAAAYRFGHPTLSPALLRLDENGAEIPEGYLSLKAAFFKPDSTAEAGIDPIVREQANQVAQALDPAIIDEVRNLLFGPPGAGGLDLGALNTQRGRDHGLPSYNDAREALGLDRIESFDDPIFQDGYGAKLASVYDSVDDVDLWVGGLAERAEGSGLVGETFQNILVDQFERLRSDDRLKYENNLSDQELAEVKSVSLTDVIERNSNVEIDDDTVMTVPDQNPIDPWCEEPQECISDNGGTTAFDWENFDFDNNNASGTHNTDEAGANYNDFFTSSNFSYSKSNNSWYNDDCSFSYSSSSCFSYNSNSNFSFNSDSFSYGHSSYYSSSDSSYSYSSSGYSYHSTKVIEGMGHVAWDGSDNYVFGHIKNDCSLDTSSLIESLSFNYALVTLAVAWVWVSKKINLESNFNSRKFRDKVKS